jgi:hypothetical protein
MSEYGMLCAFSYFRERELRVENREFNSGDERQGRRQSESEETRGELKG